jgi:N-acetylneuraminic acid mutarotase
VSGTITDGSGHGWPLYAKIAVAGDPRGPVYTNPATGRYRVDLPAGATYTLHVSAAGSSGYQSQDPTVTLAGSDVREDVALPVDPDRCTAPGYAFSYDGIGTGFEGWSGTTPQDGWTIGDPNGQGQTWQFDDPGKQGNLTGDTGNFAIVDSGLYGYGVQDTTLTTPDVDLSGVSAPRIGFDTDYVVMFNWSSLDVSVSVDGGSTWTNVWRHFFPNLNGHVDIPIPQAAGKSSVKVQFSYYGHWHGWWELDNVFVGARSCDPIAGGLVDGVVRDANTGDGLAAATVTAGTTTTTSIASPDDPELPDGFYSLFSASAGETALTVSDRNYAPAQGVVRVAAQGAVTKDWTLRAGRLSVRPGAISTSVRMGNARTVPVTFRNTGTASLRVDLSERDGGTPATGDGAPLARVKTAVTTHALARSPVARPSSTAPPSPDDAPWTNIADYPSATMDNLVAYHDGLTYSVAGVVGGAVSGAGFVYDPQARSWNQIAALPEPREAAQGDFIGNALYVAGGWDLTGADASSTYAYDPDLDTWTKRADLPVAVSAGGAATLDGKLYVVGGCTGPYCAPASSAVYSYDPASDTWTRHADYPRALAFLGCAALGTHLVCAGGSDPDTGSSVADTYSYDPASNTWSRAADLPYRSWGGAYAGADGKLQVFGGVANDLVTNQAAQYDPASDTWSALPNANNAVYRGGGSCGLYSVGGASGSFNGTAVAELLPGYDDCTGPTDVAWLSESATSFDIPPGHSRTVPMSVDSRGFIQPGQWSARLVIATDTPYDVQPLDVRLQVDPPHTWGRLQGTVTDTDRNPIRGATVEICRAGKPSCTSVHTDRNGHYQLWLDEHASPVQVSVSAAGYQRQSAIETIRGGMTTTADFRLAKLAG